MQPWVPIVASLITGLVVGTFTLRGVRIGQRLTRQQKREERLEDQRLEQRDAIIELIDTVEHWLPQAEMVALFLGKASQSDLLEFVDTDSSKALRESVRSLKRILVKCRLIVIDAELRPLVLRLAQELDRNSEEINGPIMEAVKRGLDPIPALRSGIQFYAEVGRLAVELQESALGRLTISYDQKSEAGSLYSRIRSRRA